MSMYSRKKARRNSKKQLGHLKLSICEDSGALTVTIHEARGLQRKEGAPTDTYVKLYMLPDPLKETKEKTKRIKAKDPVFNEKFNFLLNDEADYSKQQLFISVWNRERSTRNEMIGCMTFCVYDLLGPNGAHGWYQLLDEHKGREENVPVPSSVHRAGSYTSLPLSPISKNFAVTLVRGPGYGFKVSVGTPVYISEVTEGQAAHQSDIFVGDLILEVEGTDVTRANGELVANMIKKQRDTLHMILQRQNIFSDPLTSSASQPFHSHSYNDISFGNTSPQKLNSKFFSSSQSLKPVQPINETRRFASGGLTQPVDMSHYQIEDPNWLRNMSSSRDRVTVSRERLPEVPEETNPDVSIVLRTENSKSGSNSGNSQKSLEIQSVSSIGRLSSSQPGRLDRSLSPTKRSGDTGRKFSANSLGSPTDDKMLYSLALHSVASSKIYGGSSTQGHSSYQPRALYSSKLSTSSVGSGEDSAYSTSHSSKSLNHLQQEDAPTSPNSLFGLRLREKSPPIDTAQQRISPTSPINDHSLINDHLVEEERYAIEWESLSRLEQKRQKSLNSLMKCEVEFCNELRKGIDVFLTPLSGVISENSHRTIFMSLERMYELSNHFCSQLKSRSRPYSSPACVSYYIDRFVDIYSNKLKLLMQVYSAYLRNSDSSRKEIAVCFTDSEFKKLIKNPPAMYSFVEAGTEYLPKMSRLLVAISYVTPLNHKDHEYFTDVINSLMRLLPPSCTDLKQNWKSETDIMENLNKAINFANGVQPFEVVIPGRMLLHEGEAQLVEKKKKKKVWLLLFNDILLITKRSTKMVFVALEDPIPLDSMSLPEIDCASDEFQILTEDRSVSRMFKVSSQLLKRDWVQKLKERATGSLGNKGRIAIKDKEMRFKAELLRYDLEKQKRTPFRRHTHAHIQNNEFNDHGYLVPSPSTVFPLTQPILPSKFMTLPNKKLETPTKQRRRIFKRRSMDFTHVGLGSQGSQLSQDQSDFSSPMLWNRINRERLESWSESFYELLTDRVGVRLFEEFLIKECSQENIQFWKACKRYSDPHLTPDHALQTAAESIFTEYISHQAPNVVNIDHTVRTEVVGNMRSISRNTFDKAMSSVYMLMERDSYSRFIKQPEFREALALSRV